MKKTYGSRGQSVQRLCWQLAQVLAPVVYKVSHLQQVRRTLCRGALRTRGCPPGLGLGIVNGMSSFIPYHVSASMISPLGTAASVDLPLPSGFLTGNRGHFVHLGCPHSTQTLLPPYVVLHL
jgi:hypothetical protein